MKISTLNKLVLGVSFVAMMGVVSPQDAQAGFKWKSAPKPEMAAPADNGAEENLMEPVIIEDPIDWKGEEVTETVPMSSPVETVAAEAVTEVEEVAVEEAAVAEAVEAPVVVEEQVEEVVTEPAPVEAVVETAEEVVEETVEEIAAPTVEEIVEDVAPIADTAPVMEDAPIELTAETPVMDEMPAAEEIVEAVEMIEEAPSVEAAVETTEEAIEGVVVEDTVAPGVGEIVEETAPSMDDVAPSMSDVPAIEEVAPMVEETAPSMDNVPAMNEEMPMGDASQDEAPILEEMDEQAAADEGARIVVIGVENGEMLKGAGADQSLIIALRQIVPANYQFAFGKNVDLGQKVSWNGEKPWGHTLAEVLYPLNLMAEVKGNILTIGEYKEQTPVAQNAFAEAETVQETVEEVVDVATEQAPIIEEMPELTGNGDDMRVLAEAETINEAPIELAADGTITQEVVETAADVVADAKKWQAASGDMLSSVLTRWTNEAGIDLLWTIDYDYVVQSDLMVEGDIQQSAAELFSLFENANPQPYARLHQEEDGQVMIVKVYETTE